MWARAESFGSLLLSFGSLLLKLLPSTLAEHLEELLTSITEALNNLPSKDNLPSKVKDGITIVKRLIDGGIAFEKPVYFLNVC